MALPERVVMRPGKRLVLAAAGSAAFTVAGILLGGFAGVLVAIAFGGMGLLALAARPWQQETVIDRTALRVTTRVGRIVVPLADIAGVGITSVWRNKTVGVLLKDPDAFVNSMSPEDVAGCAQFLKVGRGLLRGGPVVRAQHTGPTGDFAELMHWSRGMFGYDLTFDPVTYDRSAEDFAALLEAYRAATPPGAAR